MRGTLTAPAPKIAAGPKLREDIDFYITKRLQRKYIFEKPKSLHCFYVSLPNDCAWPPMITVIVSQSIRWPIIILTRWVIRKVIKLIQSTVTNVSHHLTTGARKTREWTMREWTTWHEVTGGKHGSGIRGTRINVWEM